MGYFGVVYLTLGRINQTFPHALSFAPLRFMLKGDTRTTKQAMKGIIYLLALIRALPSLYEHK
jgi:hypothetical protein